MGSSIYIAGEDKNVKPTFRLNPKETTIIQDAPDALVKPAEPIPPAIDTPETIKPKARPRSRKSEPKEARQVSGTEVITKTSRTVVPINNTATVEPPLHPAEILINSKVNDDQYEVQIYNTYDASIHSAPKTTVQDIRAYVRGKFGNGSYRLKVLRNGIPIDTEAGYLTMTITDAPVKSNGVSDEVDVVTESKKRVAVKKADVETAKAEAELQDIKDRQEEEREKRAKAKNTPIVDPAVAALAKQVEELTKIVTAQAQKPQTSLVDEAVKLAPLIAVFAPLMKPKEENTTKLVLDLFAKMDEREDKREERAERRDEKREEKFEKLLEKIEDGKNKGGFLEELEKAKLVAEMFQGKDEDDFDFDPANPISSVIGGALKYGFKGIREFMKDPEARKVISHIAANIGKRPEELTEGDMGEVNAELETLRQDSERRKQQAQLPSPLPRPPVAAKPIIQLPPPIRLDSLSGLKVASNPAVVVEPVSASPVRVSGEPIPSQPVTETAASVTPASVENSVPSPVAPAAQTETPTTTAETPATETLTEPAISQADVNDDLRETITNTVRQMVLDLKAERTAFKWWDYAATEWPKKFTEEFIRPKEWALTIEQLKSNCDEGVWNELLKSTADEKQLMNFNGSIYTFCQQMNAPVEELASGAAQ